MRLTVTGSDFDSISAEFAASLRSGVVQGVPVGSDRTLKLEALDSAQAVLYQGSVPGITVTAGATADAGEVAMVLASAPASGDLAITSPAGPSPHYSNTSVTALTGTCTANPPHNVVLSGALAATNACTNGGFSFDLSSLAPNGSYDVTIAQVELFSRVVTATVTWRWVYDTLAPAQPTLTPTSLITGANTIQFASSCEGGATVTLTDGASPQTVACSSGSVDFTVSRFVDGMFGFNATQTDRAGNTSPVAVFALERDTAQPPAPLTTPVAGSTMLSNALLGTLTATCKDTGHTLHVVLDGNTAGETTAPCTTPGGTLVTAPAVGEGSHTYAVYQTRNITAAVASASATFAFIYDATAPAAPSLDSPVPLAPGGSTTLTSGDGTITLAGGCESGAQVHLTVDSATAPGSPVSCSNGAYQIDFAAGAPATQYALLLTQTDAAGNSSLSATGLGYTHDTGFPATPTLVGYNGGGGSTPRYSQSLASIQVSCDSTLTQDSVRVSVDLGGETNGTCASSAYSYPVGALSEGKHTFAFRDLDTSPDPDRSSGTLTVVWWKDNSVARVTIDGGSPDAYTLTVSNAANSVTITGTCEPGATVNVTGSSSKNTTCSGDRAAGTTGGTYAFTFSAFSDDTRIYTLHQTDLATNTTALAATLTWTRTTPVPAAPTIDLPAAEPFYSKTPMGTLSGTCLADHTVLLSGAAIDNVQCNNLQYAFAIPTPAENATYEYFVSQTSNVPGGQSSPSVKRTWFYDTIKPGVVKITNPTTTPFVTANTDVLIISGTCEVGAGVNLSGDETQGPQPCSAGGTFSFTVDRSAVPPPAPGSFQDYSFVLTQRDAADNLSNAVNQTWRRTVDVPVTPTISHPASLPVRSENNLKPDNTASSPLVANGLVVIQGSCTSASAHTVVLDDGLTDLTDPNAVLPVRADYPYQAACASSAFSISLDNKLKQWNPTTGANDVHSRFDGTYNFSLYQARDSDGAGSAGVFVQVIVDATAPAEPGITLPKIVAAGTSQPYVGPGPITVAGSCETGATVNFSGSPLPVGGNPAGVPCANGAYTFAPVDAAADGVLNAYTVTQSDALGNTSSATILNWTRDSELLPPPALIAPASNPYLSNVGTLTLIGVCTPGLTVRMLNAPPPGGPDEVPPVTCTNGNYTFQTTRTSTGQYVFYLVQQDGAVLSQPVTFTWNLDLTKPAVDVTYALPLAVGIASTPPTDPALANPAHDAVFEFKKFPIDAGDTIIFECNSDQGGWAACTSPEVIVAVPAGPHSLWIRAKDSAGNVTDDGSIYKRYWYQQSHDTVALYHLNEASAPFADATPYKTGAGDPAPTYDGPLSEGEATTTTSELSPYDPGGVTGNPFGNRRVFDNDAGTPPYLSGPDLASHGGVRTKITVEAVSTIEFGPTNMDLAVPGGELVLVSKWDATDYTATGGTNGRLAWEFGFKRGGGNPTSTKLTNMLLFFRTWTQVLNTTTGELETQQVTATSNKLSGPGFPNNQNLPWSTTPMHVAVTWNRGVVTFFHEGARKSQRTIGVSGVSLLPDGTGNLILGARQVDAGGTKEAYLDGTLDEVRISQDLCYLTAFTLPTGEFGTGDCAP